MLQKFVAKKISKRVRCTLVSASKARFDKHQLVVRIGKATFSDYYWSDRFDASLVGKQVVLGYVKEGKYENLYSVERA
jgi:hypothetical protein